jgi:hypothetical protein
MQAEGLREATLADPARDQSLPLSCVEAYFRYHHWHEPGAKPQARGRDGGVLQGKPANDLDLSFACRDTNLHDLAQWAEGRRWK